MYLKPKTINTDEGNEMAYDCVFSDLKIVVSGVSDGNMSSRGRHRTWGNKYQFCRKFFDEGGGFAGRLISARVCHGVNFAEVDRNSGAMQYEFDGLFTRDPMVVLAMDWADCFPVALWDPDSRWRALIHVGFQGAAKEIVSKAISKMIGQGASVRNIQSFIGPGICQDCYEFGLQAAQLIGEKYHQYLRRVKARNKYFIDISGIILEQMRGKGVLTENISHFKECTFETEDLFSARRQRPFSLDVLQAGALFIGSRYATKERERHEPVSRILVGVGYFRGGNFQVNGEDYRSSGRNN